MADRLGDIVESGEPKRLATGFVFTEGPLWQSDGSWLFVDIEQFSIFRLLPGGQPELLRDNSGRANGMTFDHQGRLLMCEGDNRRVTRREPDGSYTTIAERVGGKRLNTPNDIVGRSDGSIYFTDPNGNGRIPAEELELDYPGVNRIAPDGSVAIVTQEMQYPNGLAFSPDERTLYVAITQFDRRCMAAKGRGEVCRHGFIQALDVADDGTLSNNRVFAEMFSAEDGVPDGMKVDVEGRVYCTGPGGVWVFDPFGDLRGIIRLPEIPANCAWGGPDNRTMLFAARTSIYTLQMKTPGTRLARAG